MTDPLQLLVLNFDYNSECFNEKEDNDEKYAVESTISLPSETILRPTVFT